MRDVVALSDAYDLVAEFGAAFELVPEALRLVRPDNADPQTTRYALVHAPSTEALARFPNLELVCSWGAGVDKLVGHRGLRPEVVLNRMVDPGQAHMMAAFAAHYVTGWHRGLFQYPAQQAERNWDIVNWTPNSEVPVGLLGFGRMGAAIGRGLHALGYPVSGWASLARVEDGIDVRTGADAFDALLGESVVLINTLPLTPATEGLFDAGAFRAMRSDALFVQLGRGRQVVEADLIAALDDGRPGGAALDTFQTEPLPKDDLLWRHPKVMVTPHAASSPSPAGVARVVSQAISAYEAGERPPGYVDRTRGY
ncbi:MAG: NAD(P)-dependent oxidoreductase [Pseudomonadota bacterium]